MKRKGDAFYLSSRQLSEKGRLVTLFSREFGLVRGFSMRRTESILPGDTVRFEHTRRLGSQLGKVTCELSVSRAAYIMTHTTAALLMNHLAEVMHLLLPEDHPYPEFYAHLEDLWQSTSPWWQRIAEMERALLATVGYGLSLTEDAVPCAENGPLLYVSPNSGRAVSAHTGAPYANRLLPLPALWGGPVCADVEDKTHALRLTGFFLDKSLHGKELTARPRLMNHLFASKVDAHAQTVDGGVADDDGICYG